MVLWVRKSQGVINLCCSVIQSCLTLCDHMDCSTPGLPVPHHLLEFAQVHVHFIDNAVQPSHPLMPSSPSALNHSQHQVLFQWVVCSHQMTRILELHRSLTPPAQGPSLGLWKNGWFSLVIHVASQGLDLCLFIHSLKADSWNTYSRHCTKCWGYKYK